MKTCPTFVKCVTNRLNRGQSCPYNSPNNSGTFLSIHSRGKSVHNRRQQKKTERVLMLYSPDYLTPWPDIWKCGPEHIRQKVTVHVFCKRPNPLIPEHRGPSMCLTFIMRTTVLRAIITSTLYSKEGETTKCHTRYWNVCLFCGM